MNDTIISKNTSEIVYSGKNGKHIDVYSNFFEIKQLIPNENNFLFQYLFKITPIMPTHINRIIFSSILNNIENDKDTIVYDGYTKIYSIHPLKMKWSSKSIDCVADCSDTNCNTFHFDLDESKNIAEFPVSVVIEKIKKTFTVHISKIDCSDLFKNKNGLDVVTRALPSSIYTSMGKHFFTSKNIKNLGYGAECWMGFYQHIHFSINKTLLNIDISAKAFYESGSLLSFLTRFLFKRNNNDITQSLKITEIEKFETIIKGLKICFTHLNDKYCRYKIKGLTRTSVSETFFKYKKIKELELESENINVHLYFYNKYNLILKYPFLPCVIVGSDENPMYIPFELCQVVSGQKYTQKLNENQTSSMIRLTCQSPDIRHGHISNAIYDLGFKSEDHKNARLLENFNINVDPNMLSVPARILKAPTLQYNSSSREHLITPLNGTWNLRDKKILQSCVLTNWAIVCFSHQNEIPKPKLDFFISELINTCTTTGLVIRNFRPHVMYATLQQDIGQTFQNVNDTFTETTGTSPQLIIFVLQNTNSYIYSQIKRLGDTVFGIPTQCVQQKNVLQPKKQFCANLCLKINSKLGGINTLLSLHGMSSPSSNVMYNSVPTMVLGIDVCYPMHTDSNFTEAICSLVGSVDKTMSRFSSVTSLQSPDKICIEKLTSMIVYILKSFQIYNNGLLPSRLILYRNGISETQIDKISKIEIQFIKDAFEEIRPGYCPPLTFAVVQRHHHVRLFTQGLREYNNIPAGTVIDKDITQPEKFDFYLCSHAGLQGTSRPSYYQILLNENSFDADTLQEFTYYLCYTYSRCTRSISVAPPVYYASLVANRTKYYIKTGMNHTVPIHHNNTILPNVHTRLQNTMYFI